MIPKGKLLALVLVFGAVGTLAATGAFTTVEAERTADVNVDGDANALLAIQPTEDPEDSSFIQQSDTDGQTFEIVLEGNNDNAAGLNSNSTTTAQDIFNITNNGEEDVDVWINTEGGAQANSPHVNTTFYIDDSNVGPTNGSGNVKNATGSNTADPVNITERIDEFDELIDPEDVVISENVSSIGSSETPDTEGIAVNIEPGQTVTVSMAIEIESEAEPEGAIDISDSEEPILNETTILAVNDQELQDINEGTTTSGNGQDNDQ